MLTLLLILLLRHPVTACEIGLALVYLWLAVLKRREWAHAAAYAVAALLALTLAACAALGR